MAYTLVRVQGAYSRHAVSVPWIKGNEDSMRTLRSVKTQQIVGETVGLRKDGSVAILFDDDNRILWFKADEFAHLFEVV